MYRISDKSFQEARKLGVEIKPSKRKEKKIDVFKNGVLKASIGSMAYKDYHIYRKENKTLAEQRKKLYKARHEKDRKKVGTPSFYADKILWT